MENTIYEKLEKPIGDYPELKINVDYYLGGTNYFSGEYNKREIYLYLKPVARGERFESSTLLGGKMESGYKILLLELTRKSQKTINLWFERISKLSKEIADLYSKGEDNKIVELIRN